MLSRFLFKVSPLAVLAMGLSSCGGSGTSSESANENSTKVGPIVVNSLGSLSEPVTITGVNSVSIGFGGSIQSAGFLPLDEGPVRDEIAYVVSDPVNGGNKLNVTSVSQKLSGTLSDNVAPGKTLWSADRKAVFALVNDAEGTPEVYKFPINASPTQITNFSGRKVATFARSADGKFLAVATVLNDGTGIRSASLINLNTNKVTPIGTATFDCRGLDFQTDSTKVWLSGTDGTAKELVSAKVDRAGTLQDVIATDDLLGSVAISSPLPTETGDHVFYTVSGGSGVRYAPLLDPNNDVGVSTPSTSSVTLGTGVRRMVAWTFPQQIYVSAVDTNGTSFNPFTALFTGTYPSLARQTNDPIKLLGSQGVLRNSGNVQAMIVSSAIDGFGSILAATGDAGLDVTGESGPSGGTQQAMTISGRGSGLVQTVRFSNSLYEQARVVDLTGQSIRQAVVIIDGRNGSVESLVAVAGNANSFKRQTTGKTMHFEGERVYVWNREGKLTINGSHSATITIN